jgi:hypothetical protein
VAKMTFEEFEAKQVSESPEYVGLYFSRGYEKLEEAITFKKPLAQSSDWGEPKIDEEVCFPAGTVFRVIGFGLTKDGKRMLHLEWKDPGTKPCVWARPDPKGA